MPPTQIGRALQELGIVWIAAHSPQAKGRVERGFATAQDRLVKGMRVAGVSTLEQANHYLETEYLPWWERTLIVQPASADDAHRPLDKQHELAAILSHVEKRLVKNGYVIEFEGKLYRILPADICTGLRGAYVRVEQRRDGSLAIRFKDKYLRHEQCERPQRVSPTAKPAAVSGSQRAVNAGGKSEWMKRFRLRGGPALNEAIEISNATS